MKPDVKLHKPCWQGHVDAIGLKLKKNTVAKDRILYFWPNIKIVYELENYYLLEFKQVIRLNSSIEPGIIFVRQKNINTAMALSTSECEALNLKYKTGTFCWFEHGEFKVAIPPLKEFYFGDWVQGSFDIIQVQPLGEPPKVKTFASIKKENIAQLFNNPNLKPNAHAKSIKDLLSSRQATKPSKSIKDLLSSPQAAKTSVWRSLFNIFGSSTKSANRSTRSAGRSAGISNSWLDSLFSWFVPAKPMNSSGDSSPSSAPSTTPQENWFGSLFSDMQSWFASGPLRSIFQSKYDNYFKDMLKMFDGNDLQKALQHAIPLDSKTQGELSQRLSFKLPTAKKFLNLLSPSADALSSIVTTHSNLFEQLQQTYEQAFKKLDAAGKIDEAVYILAELLGSPQRAIDYLEAKELYEKAAEVAEIKELSPDLRVRLWVLAKKYENAYQVAIENDAFASAVTFAERRKDDRAVGELRQFWANYLAEVGFYNAAINAIWPVEQHRHKASNWLSSALQSTSPEIINTLLIAPDIVCSAKDESMLQKRLSTLLEEKTSNAAQIRLALLEGFDESALGKRYPSLANALTRKIIQDYEQKRISSTEKQNKKFAKKIIRILKKLDRFSLSEDVSKVWPSSNRSKKEDCPTIIIESSPPNTKALDAYWLNEDQVLISRGEAGAQIVHRTGKNLHDYSAPCHFLIPSTQDSLPLLIESKYRSYNVRKITTNSWANNFIGELPNYTLANKFDGRWLWATYSNNNQNKQRVTCYDIGKTITEIFSVTDTGPVLSFGLADKQTYFLTMSEIWTYQNTGFVLRRRSNVSSRLQVINQLGYAYGLQASEEGWRIYQSDYRMERVIYQVTGSALEGKDQIYCSKNYLVVKKCEQDRVSLFIFEMENQNFLMAFTICLMGATDSRIHMGDSLLHVCDNLGRTLLFDLNYKTEISRLV